MNDPIRLSASTDSTDLEKELLGAWGDERPTAAARDKMLAALGLAGSAAAAAAGSMAPKAIASGWALVAKWIGLGALVVGATAVGVVHVAHHDDVAPLETTTPPAARAAAPAPPPQATATAPTTVEIADAPPQHARAHVAPAGSSITQQVAALDRARAALDAGDAARAVRLVDAYESEYPGGAFVQEAEVVRIESLVREGKSAEADRAGKHFLASYPRSPHDARVRSLLGYAREP